MAENFSITVNDAGFRAGLNNFADGISSRRLLKPIGPLMVGSVQQTFRDQGSPAGSWAPLAKSTLRRDKLSGSGRKILIRSGQLKNDVNSQLLDDRVLIGADLVYARIHQLGGFAGRGHKARIPARPYLVFRPEDPRRIVEAMDAVIAAAARRSGLAS